MTTKVTIINSSEKDSPDQHVVLVKRDDSTLAKLYPGEQTFVHLWVNMNSLTIEEAPLES